MATSFENFISMHRQRKGLKHAGVHIGLSELDDYGFAAYPQGDLFGKYTLTQIGGGVPYVAGGWTVTTTANGSAVAQDTGPSGGIVLTCGTAAADVAGIASAGLWTSADGKVVVAKWRASITAIDKARFLLGVTKAATAPHATASTDGVWIESLANTGAIYGCVRGNAGTQANSSTLDTVANATAFTCGFAFEIDATNPWGFFHANGVITRFTAAQLAQLVRLSGAADTLGSQAFITPAGSAIGSTTFKVQAGKVQIDI